MKFVLFSFDYDDYDYELWKALSLRVYGLQPKFAGRSINIVDEEFKSDDECMIILIKL